MATAEEMVKDVNDTLVQLTEVIREMMLANANQDQALEFLLTAMRKASSAVDAIIRAASIQGDIAARHEAELESLQERVKFLEDLLIEAK